MFDSEEFIKHIQDNPPLWNRVVKEYSDFAARLKCWNSIGELMYQDWQEVPQKKRNVRVQEMKNKWRHIRDAYTKYLYVKINRTEDSKKRKKYVYADLLTFIIPFLEKNSKLTTWKRQKITEKTVPAEDSEEEEDGPDGTRDLDDSPQPQEVINQVLSQPTPKRKLVQYRPQTSTMEEDPDKLFILSLLPDYKKLNEDEKLDFKILALQYFRSVRHRKSQQNIPSDSWIQYDEELQAQEPYTGEELPTEPPKYSPDVPHDNCN